MRIRLEHQNIGAALMQIAENPQFTAINTLKINGQPVNNGFLINGDIAVLCKYASDPNVNGEYFFSFKNENMNDVKNAKIAKHNVFLALICVEDGEICCLTVEQFDKIIENRKQSAKTEEEQYLVIVTAPKRASLKAYTNAAGVKRKTAGKMIIIPRNAFPDVIFIK